MRTEVIPSFPDYLATDDGKIFKISGTEMKQYTTKFGYKRTALRRNKVRKHLYVHRLVCEAFIGPLPHGLQVDHINGNRTDNTLENLRYVTAKENINHKKDLGTAFVGEKHFGAKLTDKAVEYIRSKYVRHSYHKSNARELADKFGVTKSNIIKIVNMHHWTSKSVEELP